MNKVKLKYSACPMRRVMSILGSKWKPIVIWVLRERTVRFGQIAANIEIISRKVLTTTLQELEADGIVARKEYEGLPPRVDYSLTPKGKALLPLLHQLADWDGVEYAAETAKQTVQTAGSKLCR